MKQSWLKVYPLWLSILMGGLGGCQSSILDIPFKSSVLNRLPTTENYSQSTITLWLVLNHDYSESYRVGMLNIIHELAETFAQIYPGTKIIPHVLSNDVFLRQISRQTELGFGPDIIFTSFEQIPILQQLGTLQSLDRYSLDLSPFRKDALKQVTYRGQLYGVPLFLHVQALCYNKTKVRQPPTTLDELILQARQGYSVGIQSGFFATFWGSGTFGGIPMNQTGAVPSQRQHAWQQWMEWLKVAQTEPNVILSADALALQKAFNRGQLAYLTCESSWIPYLRETLGANKLGVVTLPRGKYGKASPLIYTGAALFNRFSSPAQTELALRFMQFTSNVEQQKKLIAERGIANISSNKRVVLDPRLYPIAGTFLEQSRTAEAISLDMFIGKLNVQDDIKTVDQIYHKVLVGEMSTAEAAKSIGQYLSRHWQIETENK